jgi:excisionase family DNA binding protein
MVESLLTVADVARLLSLKPARVYALAEERDPAKRLPAVRIGRLLRFRAEDLDRFVAERAS